MAFANVSSLLKAPTMLEQLLEEINFQRTKEMRQLLKDGESVLFNEGGENTYSEMKPKFYMCMCIRKMLFLYVFIHFII
jgi:hypothetical protein